MDISHAGFSNAMVGRCARLLANVKVTSKSFVNKAILNAYY